MQLAMTETMKKTNSDNKFLKPRKIYMTKKTKKEINMLRDNEMDSFDNLEIDDYDISSIPNDFNIITIFSQIEKGSLKIPPFQRNYVWDVKRASKLIESILRGLPIPQIFLYETEKKEYLVIDGQQRLMSIYYFMKERFPVKERRAELKNQWSSGHVDESVLNDDNYFNDFKLKLNDANDIRQSKFKNATYSMLSVADKEVFDLRTIRCVIIKQNKPNADDSCVFEIFHRLNSGGINLHPQEIRMSLYYSKFYDMLNELNNIPDWRRLLGSEHPEFHTKDIEIILRGFALLERGESYTPSLIKFLNNYSKKCQDNAMEDNYYLKNLFLSFLQACKHLPDDIFVKNDKFHLALFESVFVAVCKKPFSQSSIVTKPIELSAIQKLAADEEFVESIQKNTTSTANVKKRLLRASFFLNL